MDAHRPAAGTLHVRLFARYAELFGAEVVTVPSAGVATVGDLLDQLRRLPGGGALGDAVLVAVNLRQVHRTAPVVAGDEIAILPPLAGG